MIGYILNQTFVSTKNNLQLKEEANLEIDIRLNVKLGKERTLVRIKESMSCIVPE